jgi:spore germination protein GerM
MRTVVLRVAALALLLLLALVSALIIRTLNRLPDSIVYFVRSENGTMTLEGVGRRSGGGDGEARLRQALEALIAGPTPQEQARGLSSAIPHETQVLGLERSNDLVSVDLSKAFEEGGGTAMMRSRLNQLFYTLTQPRGVERVALHIAGERVRVFSGEGLIVANPWRRPPDAPLPRW